MSYSAVKNRTATGSGLLRFREASGTTVPGAGQRTKFSVSENLHGSSVATIDAAGIITLPAGYYYLLEASFSVTSTSGPVGEFYFQFYDENASAYIGTSAFMTDENGNNSDDKKLFSRDDMARVWVDATSLAGSVSFQQVNASVANSVDDSNIRWWVGYSRCLVWRFD